jgi:hypothetical protein
MSKTVRVTLVNDYEIVLEGLRALRPYAPEMRVVELDVKSGPRRAVDVTPFDTYGEEDRLVEHANSPQIQRTVPSSCSSFWEDTVAVRALLRRFGRVHFESGARDPDRRWDPGSQPRGDGHVGPTIPARGDASRASAARLRRGADRTRKAICSPCCRAG